MAFTFAGEGDGEPVRGQVFDVREDVDSVVNTPRQQLFAAAPIAGVKVDVWLHADRTSAAGTMQAELRSAASQAGGTTNTRATAGITDTGLYLLAFTIPDPPITNRWWFLSLTPAAAGEYDIAAAVSVT